MKVLASGNEAIAMAVADSAVMVASAYPGTPSTEILENIIEFSKHTNASWAVNEKNAFEVAYGASVAGVRSITSMKHVGLNVAADPLFTSAYTGVNGGMVVVVADDPGMHSSQNEQDSRNYAAFSNVPMLEPSNADECYRFTRMAFEMSETFDTPIFIKTSTRIAHTKDIIDRKPADRLPKSLKYKKDIQKYVMVPAFAKQRHVILEERIVNIKSKFNNININVIEKGKNNKLGIICAGVDYNYIKEAFPETPILKLATVYPLPEKIIQKFAAGMKKVLVIEALSPYLENAILAMGVKLEKRLHSKCGELSVDALAIYKGEKPQKMKKKLLAQRPPALCKGCSHRIVFETFRDLELTVTGDIGCYTLGSAPPFSAMDTCLCMGASVGMGSGFEKAKHLLGDKRKVVSVIGESTFLHTGIQGVIEAVYNKTPITLVVLDNYVTAMTGHQPNPSTGVTANGKLTPRIEIEPLVRSLGVKNVSTVKLFDKKTDFKSILEKEIAKDEISVIIAEAPCIFYKRRFAGLGIDRK